MTTDVQFVKAYGSRINDTDITDSSGNIIFWSETDSSTETNHKIYVSNGNGSLTQYSSPDDNPFVKKQFGDSTLGLKYYHNNGAIIINGQNNNIVGNRLINATSIINGYYHTILNAQQSIINGAQNSVLKNISNANLISGSFLQVQENSKNFNGGSCTILGKFNDDSIAYSDVPTIFQIGVGTTFDLRCNALNVDTDGNILIKANPGKHGDKTMLNLQEAVKNGGPKWVEFGVEEMNISIQEVDIYGNTTGPVEVCQIKYRYGHKDEHSTLLHITSKNFITPLDIQIGGTEEALMSYQVNRSYDVVTAYYPFIIQKHEGQQIIELQPLYGGVSWSETTGIQSSFPDIQLGVAWFYGQELKNESEEGFIPETLIKAFIFVKNDENV